MRRVGFVHVFDYLIVRWVTLLSSLGFAAVAVVGVAAVVVVSVVAVGAVATGLCVAVLGLSKKLMGLGVRVRGCYSIGDGVLLSRNGCVSELWWLLL